MRAGLVAAALCVVAVACDDRGRSAQSGGAANPPVAARPSGGAEGQATAPRRGDRHARGAAGRARPIHEIVGTIVRSERGQVAIRPKDGREVTLQIGPRTTVTAPGVPGQAPLTPGEEVRASWRSGEGDPPTALSVDVRSGPPRDPWTDRG
jgi:hypothetical protein